MPIRDYNPNIEAIKAEVASLEEQRGILKSPDMIEALKAEIEGLTTQRLKVLADIKKAKKGLDDTVAKQVEQAEVKLKELQEQYGPEQGRLEGLITEASIELVKVTAELNAQKDAIPEVMAIVESQKKAADEHLASTTTQTEVKLRELNDRRNTCRQDVEILYQGLKDKEQEVEVKVKGLEAQEQAVIEKEKALALQIALQNEARAREQKFNTEQEAALKLEYDKLNIRRDALAGREKAITEREDQTMVHEADLSNLKSELDLREQKVIQDRLDMAPKWDEILKREADLEVNWKTYAKAKKKLDLKLKELEG